MKALRWVLWTAGGVLALLIVAGVIFALTFDANKYKPDLIRLVKEKTGRTLNLDGNIRLTVFPKIGASLGPASISEVNAARVFARIDNARVAVALLPLLSRELVVDQVELRGLQAQIIKHKDGTTNVDDLLHAGKESTAAKGHPPARRATPPARGEAPRLDVSGIRLRDARLSWVDEAARNTVSVVVENLSTGRIADNVPGKLEVSARVQETQPALSLALTGSTGYRAGFSSGTYALSGLDLKLEGDAPGAPGLSATLKGDLALAAATSRIDVSSLQVAAKTKDGSELTLSAPKLFVSPERSSSEPVKAEVKVSKAGQNTDLRLALAAVEARGAHVDFSNLNLELQVQSEKLKLHGQMGSPLAVDLSAKTAELKQLNGAFAVSGPALPPQGSKLAVNGNARVNWANSTAAAALSAKIDDSDAALKLDVADFAKPRLRFDLAADRLDVDRYLPPKPASAQGTPAKPAAGQAPPAGHPGAASAAGDEPLDFSMLKSLDLSGSLRIGSLVFDRLKMSSVRATLQAAGGRLDVAPLSADLYGGHSSGNVRVVASGNAIALREQLTNVSLGPLLRDFAQKDILEGRGNLNLDVSGAGATVNALKRSLDGKGNLVIRDGALKGINLGAIARNVSALVGGQGMQEVAGSSSQKTDFSELSATFVMHNGVAHNDDLVAKSPFLRLTGAGDIDIGQNRVDYRAKATVVQTAVGQGGRESSTGTTLVIPVHAFGPLDALRYQVDVQNILVNAAKEQAKKQLEEELKRQVPQDLQGPVGNALKGLLGR